MGKVKDCVVMYSGFVILLLLVLVTDGECLNELYGEDEQ